MRSRLSIAGLIVFLSLLAGLIYWSPVQTGDTRGLIETAAAPQAGFGNIPAFFEPNRGQHDARVRFKAHSSGYSLFLTATDAVYVVPERKPRDTKTSVMSLDDKPSKAAAVWMKLQGADPNSRSEGLDELAGKTNYFTGEKGSAPRTDIPTFQGVRMADVYDGIDVVWRGIAADKVQYDFVVRPGADPGRIAWSVDGADSVSLNADGDLLIATEFGTIRQQKPYTYQEIEGVKTEVPSSFTVSDNSVGFSVGNYDPSRTLVIDPVVLGNGAFSTYLGSSGWDAAYAVEVDKVGNVYVTGYAGSGFPTTSGTYDTSQNGDDDVFVTKLNRAGNGLIYSTFIGGSGRDQGETIYLESSGAVVVAGYTQSSGFPTTGGAFDTTYSSLTDAFITKLNADGNALVFSTFFGGNTLEEIRSVTEDSSGNIYVTGYTYSTAATFPLSSGAFQTTRIGETDAFVSKLNSSGTTLIYSTLLGGTAHENVGQDIVVDSSGNAYIVGGIIPDEDDPFPTPFPTTGGAYDTTLNGSYEAFVTKFNSTGTALSYSTLIGGSGIDIGKGIVLGSSNEAIITGFAADSTTDYPTTGGAYDTTANGSYDTFVTRFNSTGTALVYSTFVGPGQGEAIAQDAEGSVYVAGPAFSGYPTTAGAFDDTYGGGSSDIGVSKMKSDGSDLSYSTFFGGSDAEMARDIAVDTFGNAIFAGSTDGSYYPQIAAYDNSFNGGTADATVSKLGCNCPKPIGDFDGDNKTDLAVFRPSTSYWHVSNAGPGGGFSAAWGTTGDVIAPADYDADGKADMAIFRPSTGYWWVYYSSTNTYSATLHGTSGDIPVQADYDGDGKADLAVWRPSDQTWRIISSLTGGSSSTGHGASGDLPAVGDYDGDGKSDLAVWRPSNGYWYVINAYLGTYNFAWGTSGDKIVPADYDGDGRTDFAIYRPSTGYWWIYGTLNGSGYAVLWGNSADQPAPGDYDGDTKADLNHWRPSTGYWYRINSSDSSTPGPFAWGTTGDVPIPSTYVR